MNTLSNKEHSTSKLLLPNEITSLESSITYMITLQWSPRTLNVSSYFHITRTCIKCHVGWLCGENIYNYLFILKNATPDLPGNHSLLLLASHTFYLPVLILHRVEIMASAPLFLSLMKPLAPTSRKILYCVIKHCLKVREYYTMWHLSQSGHMLSPFFSPHNR